ncbi:MAG: hypothetical protein V3T31_02520 [candidate division Zixibacteria bacterium]
MKYPSLVGVLFMIGAIALAQFIGCSAVGYGVGSVMDKHSHWYRAKPLTDLKSIDAGEEVRITTDNDSIYVGIFSGVEAVDYGDSLIRSIAIIRVDTLKLIPLEQMTKLERYEQGGKSRWYLLGFGVAVDVVMAAMVIALAVWDVGLE